MSNQSNFNKFLDEIILEVENELEEETTSGDIAGYETPNAFSGNDKKSKKKTKDVSTQAGYTVVNEAKFKWPKIITVTKTIRHQDSMIQKGEYRFQKEFWGGGMYQQGYSHKESFYQKDLEKWIKDGSIVINENVNEARHIDRAYILLNLQRYKKGQQNFDGLVDGLSVDLGIKQNRRAVKNLESHLSAFRDELEDLSNNDMRGVAYELMNMRFENVNEGVDYKKLAKLLLSKHTRQSMFYDDDWGGVGIGGNTYQKGELRNQFPGFGDSTTIKNLFYGAQQNPKKTKSEIEKLTNGKIKVDVDRNGTVIFMKEGINEGIWPKSKLADSFEMILSAELKKFKKGIWYVVGHDLFYNDKKVLKIGGNDSVESILKKLKKKKLPESVKRKNRWLELKNDESMHTNKKLSVGMMNMRNQLKEVEKYLGWYNKLKNVNEVEAQTYFKRTVSNIGKIKERIVNIARKIQELEKDEQKPEISEGVNLKKVISILGKIIDPFNDNQNNYSDAKHKIEQILSKNGYKYSKGESKGLSKHYEFYTNGNDTIKLVITHSPKGNVYFTAMEY